MNSLAYENSKHLAIRIVRLSAYLRRNYRENVMSNQLLKCGTSVGANLAEATCAISRSDFISKVYIALKETSEVLYWLELLYETEYLTREQYISIRKDAQEIYSMLSSTTRTMHQKSDDL